MIFSMLRMVLRLYLHFPHSLSHVRSIPRTRGTFRHLSVRSTSDERRERSQSSDDTTPSSPNLIYRELFSRCRYLFRSVGPLLWLLYKM